MNKTRSTLASILLKLIKGSKRKKGYSKPASDDFESLTGKELPTWQYVQTKEDFEHLKFYKSLYERQKTYHTEPVHSFRVPQILHFIWIGGRSFPRESVENVRTWMAKHPSWTIKFWTDRERPVPVPGMEFNNVCNLNMTTLGACFEKSDNYGEKSDLLRLEILYRDGGIYIDHDVKCFKSFDPLNAAYDFYCGIDMPYRSSLPSCIYTTNNLIGVKPQHPIILRSMELIEQQWDPLQKAYPGDDRDSMLNRVLHRTFWLFGEAVKQRANQHGNRDIVFPAYYFDAPHDDLAIWARHQYAGVWHETETQFEKMVRQRLVYLSKKSNKMLLFIGLMFGLNLIGFLLLFLMIKFK
ncbi:MAG: glycosyltransferase family 32 protein [Parachlamydiales bacterium]